MNASDDPKAWLAKGRSDLLNIENNVAARDVPWDSVAFHAQQAAEKALKAFLVHHRSRFPRTHDLSALLELCLILNPTLASLREECLRLTPFAVERRYPEMASDPVERAEGEAAHADAMRVWAAIVPLIDPVER